jgi:DegV family protein with EDD domain
MTRIRVVTDNAADLDLEVAVKHGVRIVQLDVRLGEFGPEVTSWWSPQDFWHACAESTELPETSSASPGAFMETFSALADEDAEGVVCITLSSKLSATCQAALIAAEAVADRIQVRVVDSLFATMAEGLIVLDAVAVAEAGGDIEVVEAAAIASRQRVRLYGAIDSLDNLHKGGNPKSVEVVFGCLFDIEPVLELRDGALYFEPRPRSRSRSLEHLASKIRETKALERLAITHAAASDIDSFLSLLDGLLPSDRISVGWLGPVIGTHLGPSAIVCAPAVIPDILVRDAEPE